MAPPRVKPIQRESRIQGVSQAWRGWKNRKINVERKKKDIVAMTEDNGWRQSQIQGKKEVKISEEKKI